MLESEVLKFMVVQLDMTKATTHPPLVFTYVNITLKVTFLISIYENNNYIANFINEIHIG